MFENYTPGMNHSELFVGMDPVLADNSLNLSDKLKEIMGRFEQYMVGLFNEDSIRYYQKHYLAFFTKQYFEKHQSIDQLSQHLNVEIKEWGAEIRIMPSNARNYSLYFKDYDVTVTFHVVNRDSGTEVFYFK